MNRLKQTRNGEYLITMTPHTFGDYQVNGRNYISNFPRGLAWKTLRDAMDVAEIGFNEVKRHYDNSGKSPESITIKKFQNGKIQILMKD
jgi:hypothetical protein